MKRPNEHLKFFLRKAFELTVFLAGVFLLSFQLLSATVSAPTSKDIRNSQISDLKKQIENYRKQIDLKSAKEESISSYIESLNLDIKKIELEIQQTKLQMEDLDQQISDKEIQISVLATQVAAKEKLLTKFLEQLYEQGGGETAEIILGQQSFSEYFAKIDSLQSFENQVKEAHDQLEASRADLESQKELLLEQRSDQEQLNWAAEDQQRSLEQEKQSENLLAAKIGNEKQALQENISLLQVELNSLQSLGVSIDIGEAVQTAKNVSQLTGVAPELLLGVLRVESGLGTNVGGGRYKSDMNPGQWDTFKKICKELGLDPDKTPVSRRACYSKNSKNGCGGWGGAMGPAQFMPNTWIGYKAQVEKTTGHTPANPWDLKDSMVALGLKLGAVDGVKSGNRGAWAKAAGMYLAGSNWDNYSWYSDRVLHYADDFKKILKNY